MPTPSARPPAPSEASLAAARAQVADLEAAAAGEQGRILAATAQLEGELQSATEACEQDMLQLEGGAGHVRQGESVGTDAAGGGGGALGGAAANAGKRYICDARKYFVLDAGYDQLDQATVAAPTDYQGAFEACLAHEAAGGEGLGFWMQYYGQTGDGHADFNCGRYTVDPTTLPRENWLAPVEGQEGVVCHSAFEDGAQAWSRGPVSRALAARASTLGGLIWPLPPACPAAPSPAAVSGCTKSTAKGVGTT